MNTKKSPETVHPMQLRAIPQLFCLMSLLILFDVSARALLYQLGT